MLETIGVWIWVIGGLLIDCILLSFVIFGGRIKWGVELNGPLRFLSKPEENKKNVLPKS